MALRRLVGILGLCLLLAPASAHAQIALVSHVGKVGTGASSSIDTTGASAIVIVVGSIVGPTLPTNSTVSDSAGNVYSLVGAAFPVVGSGGSNSIVTTIWLSVNPTTSATHTFTLTGGFPSFEVTAWSGTDTSSPLLLPTTFSNGSTGSTSVQPGSLTPGRNGCVLIAGTARETDNSTVTVNSSFTISDQNPWTSGAAIGSTSAYLIQTSAGAVNPTFSWTSSGANSAAMIVLQPPISGAGGGGQQHAYAF